MHSPVPDVIDIHQNDIYLLKPCFHCFHFQKRKGLADLDGASLLKENQLYALFPSIDRHFLQDIFRDHK